MNPTATEARVRDVVAIDGEGLGKEGHIYGLLLAYSSKPDLTTTIDDWDTGLSTLECLEFLLRLKHGHNTICCSFFINYDVTMWLRDLTDDQKTALWESGWVVWFRPKSFGVSTHYYIRYIPNKIFFVGTCSPEMVEALARGESAPSPYNWPSDRRCILIYDVSSFTQKSFVKSLDDWHIPLPPEIAEMKAKRGGFTAEMADEIEHYCELEMIALAQYVQTLDKTFQEEGIKLPGWYGPGAIASVLLKRHHVGEALADPTDPDLLHAVMSAYFGGRTELFRMGHVRHVHNYDINSAYPSAARAIPDLVHGHWYRCRDSTYLPYPYALWRVAWNVPRNHPFTNVGPLPFRLHREVLYPSAGEGWYHASEVQRAHALYGPKCTRILDGYIYQMDEPRYPFLWLNDAAARRVALKHANDPRHLLYKYFLNSIYGKLAQHASEEGKVPPFQCYYAAGFITAQTRADLLTFMLYRPGQRMTPPDDLVMVATDGVFCTEPRDWNVGPDLGQFEDAGMLDDAYIIQPGVYYTREGKVRTRGFGVTALNYETVAHQWAMWGIEGLLRFSEERFIGLGTCAGTHDYSRYGQWVTFDGRDEEHPQRLLSLYPSKKFPDTHRMMREGTENVSLTPYDTTGLISAPYVPRRPNDPSWALEAASDALADVHEQQAIADQPDYLDEIE